MNHRWLAGLLVSMLGLSPGGGLAAAYEDRDSNAIPTTVYFPSGDGKTTLVAYVFEPTGAGSHPGIVMLHGRAGPYSASVNKRCTLVAPHHDSVCGAATLSMRHAMWGHYWAQHGYVAVLVDSFGPRGVAHGFGRFTHGDPDRDDVNEKTVRPLDAEGALTWLVASHHVLGQRVVLQGWSNGGSTALNTMYRQATGRSTNPATRFRAALVFYPGCGPAALISQHYEADTDLWTFLGSADEEVSPVVCANVLKEAKGRPVNVTTFAGATHDFDDPGEARQAVAANRKAKAVVMDEAATLVDDPT